MKEEHLIGVLRIEQHRWKAWERLPYEPADVKKAAWTVYVTAHHDSQAELRAARHEFWDDITQKIHEAASKNDQGAFNKLITATYSRKNSPIQVGKQTAAGMMYVQGSKSILTQTVEQAQQRWHEHFSDILSAVSRLSTYNRPGVPIDGSKADGIGLTPDDFLPPQQHEATHLDNLFTMDELNKASENGKEGTSKQGSRRTP